MVGSFAAGSGKYQYRKKACLNQVINIHYPCSGALFPPTGVAPPPKLDFTPRDVTMVVVDVALAMATKDMLIKQGLIPADILK